MSTFGSPKDWLDLTVQRLMERRDRENSTAHANYIQAHKNWLRNGRRGEMPVPPGTMIIVSSKVVIDDVEYLVPSNDLVYRLDLPLCDPLPVPQKVPLPDVPQIGAPFYADEPLGLRHILSPGRAKREHNGIEDTIEVDGVTIKYRLMAFPNPAGVSAWWERVV